ncbi:hypothetical protein [Pseudomonas sp. B329]|uniref:hypothetical protein n=1 Tax=Pseudomonas sp. B329 TaxID=1553459 RepID=UPI002002E829|nr:hypothetical protein [Pseudomonas sp. B329]MCK3865563.1 hypothetical protein [Pseudomonas sp. B329]
MTEHFLSVRNEETVSTTKNFSPGINLSNRSSFTIHAAEAGSSMQGGRTMTGHVFLEINTPGYRGSIGFSPGSNLDTSKDNISTNDHNIYKDTSSHRFEFPNNPVFQSVAANLAEQANGFARGSIDPGNYNLLLNNCIHFVEKILSKAGIEMKLASTPNGVAKEIDKVPEKLKTPLLIDLDGDGITTLPIEHGVKFDYEGDSNSINTGWASKNSGFLIIDRNDDGIINSGKELFGDHTPLPNGEIASDGVMALTALDNNYDNLIDDRDAVWSDLKVWQDLNSNGVSEANELQSLIDIGLKSINLSFTQNSILDEHRNIHEFHSTVNWNDGRITDITDVLFRVPDVSEDRGNISLIDQSYLVDVVGSIGTVGETYL